MNLAVILLAPVLLAGETLSQLEIDNARPTFGYLGAVRPKKDGILPGDILFFTFDAKNLMHDAQGNASYSIAVDVTDPQGKVAFQIPPYNAIARNFFGGNSVPCSAHLEIPVEAKPGEYTMRVTLEDRQAKIKKTLERKGKVLPLDFGLVQIATFADREARVPSPPLCVVGGNLYLHFGTVGFARDKKTQQPDIHVSLKILDDQGMPTIAQPLIGHVNNEIPSNVGVIPLQFGVTLNRVGRYHLELTAEDKISGKKDSVQLPLRIVAAE